MRPPQGGKIHVINIFVPNKTANFSGIQFSTTLKTVWQTQFQVIERGCVSFQVSFQNLERMQCEIQLYNQTENLVIINCLRKL